jgi:hypothetical protein
MSKIRNIPDNMKPHWECVINGVKYTYVAGAEGEEVPDEVAAAIDSYNAMLPKENPPETDEQMAARVAEKAVAGLMLDITSYALSDTPVTCPAPSVADFDAVVASKYQKPITVKYKIDGVISTVGDYQVKYTVVEGAVTDPVITFHTVADGESGVESIGELQFTKGGVGTPSVYVAFVATEFPAAGE